MIQINKIHLINLCFEFIFNNTKNDLAYSSFFSKQPVKKPNRKKRMALMAMEQHVYELSSLLKKSGTHCEFGKIW